MKSASSKLLCMFVAALCMNSIFAAEITIKLGHAGPLSGSQSASGKDNERGVKLAIDELNASNFKVGVDTVKFELISEDDQADPKQGVTVAQKLIDSGVKAVIGHYNSGVAIPASKIYNEAGVPMIAAAASNPKLTQQGFQYVFRLAANDNIMGGAMAKFAASRLKAKTVSVIDDRTSYGTGVADIFAGVAKEQGMQILGRDYTTDKATDFMSILTKIKAQKPDAIFLGGFYPQGGLLARQMKQLGMDIPLLGGDGLCSKEIIPLSGGIVEGKLFCAQGGAPLLSLPGGKAFQEKFIKAFGVDIDVYAPAYYVATLAVAESMKQAGSTEPAKFIPQLAKIKFPSLLGDVKFDQHGDWENPPVTIYEVVKGKLQPLKVQ